MTGTARATTQLKFITLLHRIYEFMYEYIHFDVECDNYLNIYQNRTQQIRTWSACATKQTPLMYMHMRCVYCGLI